MKEREEKLIGQKERNDATMNFVSRQAQEAILDPNVPEWYKDYLLKAAIETIRRISDSRPAYNSESQEVPQANRSHTVYKAK